MKKSLLILTALFAFTLASCSSNSGDNAPIYPTDNSIETNPSNGNEGELLPPNYVEPSYSENINSNVSPKSDVEETVELVYDTVVSIESYSNTALSRGSGVLFAEDENLGMSFVVTCYHVIDGGDRFYVNTTDGKQYKALVVGAYLDMDLAVLSIEATNLKYASFFDDSDSLKLGSTVVCIGNPLGTLPGSVSTGIVSYINREIPVDDTTIMRLIQTDVAINSGNSGGGLFNTKGNLIGIVNAKYASDGIEGLGFAIPINDVRSTVSDIMATARYDKANNKWDCGYVINDYEFAFKIKNGYYQHGSFINPEYIDVVYITDIVGGNYYSGSDKFYDEDVIEGVKIKHKGDNKVYTLPEIKGAASIIKFLNDNNVVVGDTITFNIKRDNRRLDVSFEIVQFKYSK